MEGLRLVLLTQIRLQARHGPVRFMQMMWACVAGCLPFGLGETRFLPSFLWLDIGQECYVYLTIMGPDWTTFLFFSFFFSPVPGLSR